MTKAACLVTFQRFRFSYLYFRPQRITTVLCRQIGIFCWERVSRGSPEVDILFSDSEDLVSLNYLSWYTWIIEPPSCILILPYNYNIVHGLSILAWCSTKVLFSHSSQVFIFPWFSLSQSWDFLLVVDPLLLCSTNFMVLYLGVECCWSFFHSSRCGGGLLNHLFLLRHDQM